MKSTLFKFFVGFICLITSTSFAANVDIEHWDTKNGARVYFIPSTALPIVDIAVAFSAGSAYDGKSPGLALLTNALLDQGTQRWSADQISEQLDSAGAMLAKATNRDMGAIRFRSLKDTKYLNLALSVFREILSKPSFPEDAYTRLKKQTLEAIKQTQQEPSTLATDAFFNALYPNTPYGHPTLGNLKSVQTITREQIHAFYKQFYVAKNATIAMVGDLDLEEAKLISERIASSLASGEAAKPIPTTPDNKTVVEHLSFPSSQTHILFGQISIAANDPDYFPLLVGNFTLGGGMTSRLFQIVRTEKGLAYNVYSHFSDLKEKGPFYIKLQTKTDQTPQAVDLVKKTLTDFIQQGPSKKELVSAKKYLTQSFAQKLASNQATLDTLMDIAFYNRPLSYLKTYQNHINAVTLNQIKNAFKKHVALNHFALITVGQTEKSNPQENKKASVPQSGKNG